MTSRREFFGLLAAAPLVAPAVVKELSVAMTPNAARAIAGFGPIGSSGFVFDEMHTYSGNDAGFEQFREMLFEAGVPRSNDKLRALMRSIPPWDAPNRLYGAYLNADGEAV